MTIDVGGWLSEPNAKQSDPCGLFIPANVPGDEQHGRDIPVPLRRRDVSSTIYINGSFADTTERLSYVSDSDCTAVFRFPLPPRAAVYSFHAVIGDRQVITKVKPRAEAREEYELAVRQGHSAVHMSQHEAGASVFEVSLGNLEAYTEAVVEFSYLRMLDSFGGGATLEWSHAATWVPPYIGSAGDTAKGVEKVASELPTFASKVSYSLSYKITVLDEDSVVRSIESPEPALTVVRQPTAATDLTATDAAAAQSSGSAGAVHGGSSGGGSSGSRWLAALSEVVSDASKDLSLIIETDPAAARRSRLHVQRTHARSSASAAGIAGSGGMAGSGGGEMRTIVLATFVPPLPPPPPQLAQGPTGGGPPGPAAAPLRKELWFVVDCSGSMGGAPISQAREAALFFVRDLPVGCGVRFNVTCFGSGYVSLYDNGCRPYDTDSECQAVSWIQNNVAADMGGTEILMTLRHIYCSPITQGYSREIIFLTDGGISGHEEQAVYDLVSRRPGPQPARQRPGIPDSLLAAAAAAARRTHVLCLGIGHGVHRGLLDGIASRSDGVALYVLDDEAIGAKTAFLKRAATARHAALRPRLTARGALLRTAPHMLPQRLFAGEPLHVLAEVLSCEPDATLELTAYFCEDDEGDDALAGGAATAEEASKAGTDTATTAADATVAATRPDKAPLRLSLPLGAAVAGGCGSGGGLGGADRGSDSVSAPSPSAGAVAAAAAGAVVCSEGGALGVLHAMAYIGSLLAGTSPLHVRADGSALPNAPSQDLVRESVVRLAVANNLVTPYTSAVGLLLRRGDAADDAAAPVVEVPLQFPRGRTLWATGPDRQELQRPFFQAAPMALKRHGRVQQSARCCPTPAAPPAATPPFTAAAPTSMVLFGAAPAPVVLFGGASAPAPGVLFGAAPGGSMRESLFGSSGLLAAAKSAVVHPFSLPASSAGSAAAPMDTTPAPDAAAAAPPPGAATEAAAPLLQPPAPASPASPAQLLSQLNLSRTTEGFWRASPQLAALLGLPGELLGGTGPEQQQQQQQPSASASASAAPTATTTMSATTPGAAAAVAALRPPGLSDDGWATVLVLGRLRASLAGQREVWADMEAKALSWLSACWPAGGPAGGRSVGSTVLAVARALTK